VNDAQFLRSAHQSCKRDGAFKEGRNYRVSGGFRGPRCRDTNENGVDRFSDADLSDLARAERPVG
jgi:hypothetical protein